MTAEVAAVAAPVSTAADTHRPLSAREKLTYACGDVAEGGINFAIGTFLLFYLTAVCGLSGSMAGLALSLTLLSDSVLDPLATSRTTPARGSAAATRSCWARRCRSA